MGAYARLIFAVWRPTRFACAERSGTATRGPGRTGYRGNVAGAPRRGRGPRRHFGGWISKPAGHPRLAHQPLPWWYGGLKVAVQSPGGIMRGQPAMARRRCLPRAAPRTPLCSRSRPRAFQRHLAPIHSSCIVSHSSCQIEKIILPFVLWRSFVRGSY